MSLALCVLASGSSGNCSMLRTAGGVILIDAGVGPRTFGKAAADVGVAMTDLRGVVLTHLDSDHFRQSWLRTLRKHRIPLWCAAPHAAALDTLLDDFDGLLRPFAEGEAFVPVEGVRFRPLAFAHDATGSYGYVIDGHGGRIGFATDLGHVPPALIEHFEELDVLAIESNYDPAMQKASGRPWFLQNRITGGRGHLSNDQAYAAVRAIFDRHKRRPLPHHVVLLHRSRDCNCPDLLRGLFSADPRIAARLVLAEPFTRTEWLCASTNAAGIGRQMTLAF